ncbi:UDP-3-O-(3-hydroxymyristoyl)glucosamine N-acyltransferase [Sneathiella sp. P13V-1]|uniref:UDP-3-O-(3-hydroxymyristoyl)glucosamine N-acyltransferase n=1 Tax=Sneathiella sp. P13V-1 TaxID=2697366 RepID=UPI00187B7AA2|nr:UDP-3-O-(3-hydroxymyristoyl)glucosamine N-acyltransferase [Sneathiella sp. P13V-1]MBE7637567.1 UDP-3-O-(3-hydroxymyristoyl)glucosamine N-acyltransferase [Sneathiella sp. P13V-1]
MADPRFFSNSGPYTVGELAEFVGAEIAGAGETSKSVQDVMPLDKAQKDHLSFLSNPKYADEFRNSSAGVCIVSDQFTDVVPDGMTLLLAKDPYKAYAKISAHFYPQEISKGVVHPTAFISDTAILGENVSVGAYSVVEDGVKVGSGTIIGSHCVIESNSTLGENCLIHAQVTLKMCDIGDQVTLHSGVRIGCDGFGFAPDPAGHIKIPQLGRVIIGNSVEIGANTTIDRGAGPDTVIGDGCWIDNLCQIGHNVKMGRGCILAAQTGISGSSVLEDFVVLGGQVGMAGHLTVGMGATVTAKSGVISDIPAGQVYAGFPARPRKEFFRSVATLAQLAKRKGPRK